MIRRPLRPTFSPIERQRLVGLLKDVHSLIVACRRSEKIGSDVYEQCGATSTAICDLAIKLSAKSSAYPKETNEGPL